MLRNSILVTAIVVIVLAAAWIATAEDRYFHAAAHNPGANDTLWLTDGQIFNPNAVDTIEVSLAFLPSGQANPNPEEFLISIGPRQARRYFVTGEAFDAAEAYRIGLVHQVTPAADLEQTVAGVLKELAGNGRRAMAEVKDLIRAVNVRPIDHALIRDTAERIAHARASDEGRQRITAFLEKRKAPRAKPRERTT